MSRLLLVVDDDHRLCSSLQDALGGPDLEVVTTGTLAGAADTLLRRPVDVVLLDQQLPDGKGAGLCSAILEEDPQTKIIFMTAFPSFDNAVEAVRSGAFDYLSKPFELEALRLTVNNALRLRELEVVEELHHRRERQDAGLARLVGRSRAMDEIRRLCTRAAASRAPVLVIGETGTGKSLLARFIHEQGQQAGEPFVALNCAALPESLAESELFGHEKGAFTGASTARRGVFEMAGKGTVLLDEIGTMSLPLQAKLLGVLEDRRFRRVGSEVERSAGARVIAATNAKLEEALGEGRFRHDLFFRLNVIRIDVPPLREHREDLPDLCAHLLEGLGSGSRALAPGELERLAEYSWPGNVRELRNLLERAAILQPHGPLVLSPLLQGPGHAGPGEGAVAEDVLRSLEEVEERHIQQTLARLGGNLSQSAQSLGISLSTLKRRVRAFRAR